MSNAMFRDLRADEIEVRVARATEKGVSLLLYKDARCDQNILDETVGSMNWERRHTRDNANCIVSIWDAEKTMWISKEDTGTESNTEKEKGLASDSFKRACFNWGIGRELYTSPFIWVFADKCLALEGDGGRWQCKDKFEVNKIIIENKRIVYLEIINAKSGEVCFTWEDSVKPAPPAPATWTCEVCGNVINGYKGPNGKLVSSARHCSASVAKYSRILCLKCIDGLKEQEEADSK